MKNSLFGKRHIRGCLRGPAGKRLGAPPLSAWLIRRTSEMPDPRRSWAGVLGASGRGSVVLNVRALYPADPQDVGAQGWLALDRPNLQAGRCKRSNPAAEAFQWRISASAKSQRGRVFVAEEKKSEMQRPKRPLI